MRGRARFRNRAARTITRFVRRRATRGRYRRRAASRVSRRRFGRRRGGFTRALQPSKQAVTLTTEIYLQIAGVAVKGDLANYKGNVARQHFLIHPMRLKDVITWGRTTDQPDGVRLTQKFSHFAYANNAVVIMPTGWMQYCRNYRKFIVLGASCATTTMFYPDASGFTNSWQVYNNGAYIPSGTYTSSAGTEVGVPVSQTGALAPPGRSQPSNIAMFSTKIFNEYTYEPGDSAGNEPLEAQTPRYILRNTFNAGQTLLELKRYRKFPQRFVSGTDAWGTRHAGNVPEGRGNLQMQGTQFRRTKKTLAKKYSPHTLWKVSRKKDSVFNWKEGALVGHIGMQGQSGAVEQTQGATGAEGDAGEMKEDYNPAAQGQWQGGVQNPPTHQSILNPAYNATIHWVRDSIIADCATQSGNIPLNPPHYDSYLDGCSVKVTLKQKFLFFDSRQMERTGCVPERANAPIYENCPQEYQPNNANDFAISAGMVGLATTGPILTAPVSILSND